MENGYAFSFESGNHFLMIARDDFGKYYLVQNEYGDMLVARYTNSEYWEQIYRMQPIADEIVAWHQDAINRYKK